MNASPPHLFQDVAIVVMTALGMSHYPPEMLVGGVFIALSGALAASRILNAGIVQRAKSLGFWGTFSTALFTSLMAGAACDAWWPDASLVFVMGFAGLSSSFVLPLILKVMSRFSNRGDEIADRAIDKFLPEDEK